MLKKKRKSVEAEETDWAAVIGRSLAFLCLAEADLLDQDKGSQGNFLESLRLPRAHVAAMLDTSPDSLGHLLKKVKKKSRRGRKAKK